MRAKCEFPAHFAFRCDPDTAALLELALDPELPQSAAMRALFQEPAVREALRRQAACAALVALRVEDLRRGEAEPDPLDASQRQSQPDRAAPSLRRSSAEQETGLVTQCVTVLPARKDRPL